MAKAPVIEESKHFGGKVTIRFYPNAHYYTVDDPDYIDHVTGEKIPLVKKRIGGATSITGVMNKGQGLMMWPMWEMSKYLKAYFESTTIKEFVDNPETIEDLLKAARDAHVKKSDRGKSVGTDAHAWVQEYLERVQASQEDPKKKFVAPEVPEVEDIAKTLRRSYLAIFNELKPKSLDDYRELPKLIFRDIEIQEAIWTEATMIQKATQAAKEWFELHDIIVHGVEQTIYSRRLLTSGRYDADITVTCTKKCGHCYRNGDESKPAKDYTGRYVTDFKSTNASRDNPKGIYSEYLAQCGVYDHGSTEEFPDREYHGHLILNGSKNEGTFATHFSFERQRNRDWAEACARVKEHMFAGAKEIKESK
jgi:hypothetical protein